MLENLPSPQDEETESEDFSNENALQTVSSNYENENPKPKRKYTGLIILSVLCILGLIFGFLQIKAASKIDDNDVFHTKPNFFSKGKYIATISIEGTIEEKNQTYDQEWLLSTIDELKNDSDNLGIMLKINSPGGAVYESDEAYLKLLDYKTSGKPIFAYFESVAASGGYYIACASDMIYANRNTLTGSIGVIYGQHLDLSKLLEKYGIKTTTITAGENKNMGSMTEPLTDSQKAILQSIADECYDQFTEIVAESRNMTIEDVKKIADGRVYTAKQAQEINLIDDISTYDEAYFDFLNYIYINSGIIQNVNQINFEPEYKTSFADYFYSVFENISNKKVATPFSSAIKALEKENFTKFYYQLY